MTAKEFSFDIEARNRMLAGVDLLAKAVGVTLGPRGRNVVLENGTTSPHITKDGDTVARTFELEDRFENMGRRWSRKSHPGPTAKPVTGQARRRCWPGHRP